MALGIIGIIIPVLPTTPFLLLASFLFTKSSKRVNDWFINTDTYNNYLKNFVETRAMTLKSKLSILFPVSIMLIVTFIFIDNVYARVFISTTFLFKYYYFFTFIKTTPVSNLKVKTSTSKLSR